MEEARRERFSSLYRLARPRVIAYALRRTGSAEEAADAVAETFAIAWRRIDEVPEGDEALLWLYVTARGVLANEWRRSVRRSGIMTRLAATLSAAAQPPPDEDRLVALACLRQLPPQDQELFMLSAWEGLDPSELGRVFGCSPTAVRVRLHRARRRLEAVLAAAEFSPPISLKTTDHPHRGASCVSKEA